MTIILVPIFLKNSVKFGAVVWEEGDTNAFVHYQSHWIECKLKDVPNAPISAYSEEEALQRAEDFINKQND